MRFGRHLVLLGVLVAAFLTSGGAALAQSEESAQDILEKMASQYEKAKSYEDTGVVKYVSGDPSAVNKVLVNFKVYYSHPRMFRFEWLMGAAKGAGVNVIRYDGRNAYRSSSRQAEGAGETLRDAVSAATGVSGRAAQTFSRLLLKDVWGGDVAELKEVSLMREEPFQGTNCYVLGGQLAAGERTELWIGKEDYLIRKVRHTSASTGAVWEEIHRDIKLNQEIPLDLFTAK